MSVIGSGYKGGEVKCRFGAVSVGGQAVSWISSTMVACIAPGAAGGQTGPVTVEVSANDGADFTSDGRMYVYAMGATVERVVHPGAGHGILKPDMAAMRGWLNDGVA